METIENAYRKRDIMNPTTEREAFRFQFQKSREHEHANADRLSIYMLGDYPCIIKKGSFQDGDECLYVPVDMIVDTLQPEFSFLHKPGKTHRVRAMKLRGTFSMGLIVPYREGLENYVKPWVSPEELAEMKEDQRKEHVASRRLARKTPFMPVYGVNSSRKLGFGGLDFKTAIITEKIHGCNARFCFSGGRLWVGSHKAMRGVSEGRIKSFFRALWRDLFGKKKNVKQIYSDVWWEIAEKLDLRNKLSKFPNMVLYGEIYGDRIQGDDFRYGLDKGELGFRAFDIFDIKSGKFLDFHDMKHICDEFLDIKTVPVLMFNKENHDWPKEFFDNGNSTFGKGQLGEGFVARPPVETTNKNGRVIYKYVGQKYLLRGEE